MTETENSTNTGFSVTRIADHLRNEIILGKYSLGERIKISDIAKKYDSSSMPVREALRILHCERIVRIIPNKGAEVHKIDVDYVRDIYDVRAVLEAHQSEIACMKMNLKAYEQLENTQAKVVEAVKNDDHAALMTENEAFHQQIGALGGNSESSRIIKQNQNTITMLRNHVGFQPGRLNDIIQEHDRLMDALFKHDVSMAAAVARHHVASARDDILQCIREFEQ